MNNYGVNFELQSRVRKYLKYNQQHETNSDAENQILNKLNKSLKKELLIESFGKLLKEIPFFKDNFSSGTIEKLSFFMRKRQLSPEEFLYYVIIFNDVFLKDILIGERI